MTSSRPDKRRSDSSFKTAGATSASTDATTSRWFADQGFADQSSAEPGFTDQGSDSDNRNDRYNYLYNQQELAGWKERIESVAERAHTTYVITNNHFESKAGVNALELKAMITGKRV